MIKRASGVLMPVFSLPGRYGIGDFGQGARMFVDFLAAARQRYWQILPLVPPGSGNSPYMSPSTCAGNPLFLDLEQLEREDLLKPKELESAQCGQLDRVDYDWLWRTRMPLLHRAFQRSGVVTPPEDCSWMGQYARFMALHDQYGTAWQTWPKNAVCKEEDVQFHIFIQTMFFRQWTALKSYANARGVRLMGDLPIYVSADSAEVWARPELFQLDEQGSPAAVAGVPPDAFSDRGQHWGNPLYDWAGHQKELFDWWSRRMARAGQLYDAVRIDHFRGFHTYWSIPSGAPDALEGHWERGPGQALVDTLRTAAPALELIAEDLGDLDENVRMFLAGSGIPGMKVLVYAFDPSGTSAYLPHNCPKDAVIYTGTHDTPTFVQWLFSLAAPEEREFALRYLRLRADEGFGWGAVCGAWAAPCLLAMAPLQDILGMGGDARVNTPGTTGPQNWSWRVRAEALNTDVARHLAEITHIYGRD